MKKLLLPLLLASSVTLAEPLVWEGSDRTWVSPSGRLITVTDIIMIDHDSLCRNIAEASRNVLRASNVGVPKDKLPAIPLYPTGLVDEIYDMNEVDSLYLFELTIEARCLEGVIQELQIK